MSESILAETKSQAPTAAAPLRLSWRKLQVHAACDLLSEIFIFVMVVFTPWAFGTTVPWAIWTMNIGGYVLGALLLVKLGIRWSTRYQFPRWDVCPESGQKSKRGHAITVALAVVSGLVLLFCLTSAWNARSTFDPAQSQYLDHAHLRWLPHSYDGPSSWKVFYNYLAIGLAFWAIRDWLLGKSFGERRGGSQSGVSSDRLRRLLWVITVSGGLLAVEGIAQRISGSGELLFLVRPSIHHRAVEQFGPYAYRSNAAQYFNLIWPLSLGLWWSLGRGKNSSRDAAKRSLALGCTFLMALCPLIATSRLGTATALGAVLACVVILWSGLHGQTKWRALALAGVLLAAGAVLGWASMEARVTPEALKEGMDDRNRLYELADPMLEESPFYGTGPGTFGNLFMMFRLDASGGWWAQLHNDWLETLITFGWGGMALLMLALVLVLVRHWAPGGIGSGRRLPRLIFLGLATCLFQARWDFPFQIYSIVFTFVVLCAIVSALSSKPFRNA